MRRSRVLTAAAVAVAATGAGVALALPSAGVRAPAPVVVYGRFVSRVYPACPASRPGALFTMTEHLSSLPAGAPLGYSSEVTTITQLGLPGAACDLFGETLLTLRLPGGTLTAVGLYYPAHGENVMAVTGGTGGYDGASGQVMADQLARGGTRYTLSLR